MTRTPAVTGTGTTSPGGKAQGPLPTLLLVLTVVTGVVDAVSILRLGRVFVANMTGNVVFTGFALVGAPGFSLSASLAALARCSSCTPAPRPPWAWRSGGWPW
jgi:Protein of unknown function (DUF1275)